MTRRTSNRSAILGHAMRRDPTGLALGHDAAARAPRHRRAAWRGLRLHHSSTPCYSALFKAGRFDELLEVLALEPKPWWHDQQWVARVLAARGDIDGAVQAIECARGINSPDTTISAMAARPAAVGWPYRGGLPTLRHRSRPREHPHRHIPEHRQEVPRHRAAANPGRAHRVQYQVRRASGLPRPRRSSSTTSRWHWPGARR